MLEALRSARRGRHRSSTTSRLRRPTLDDVFLSLTGHAAEEAQVLAEIAEGRARGKERTSA